MEAGGATAAACENAGGMNGDVLKIAKMVQELKVYKWDRSKFRLEIKRWLPIITAVESWKSLPNKIKWLLPKWSLVWLWNGFIQRGASGRTLSPGSLFLLYMFVKIAFKCQLFSSPKKGSHRNEKMAQSIHQQSGKGSISLFVTMFSGLLRSLLSWPLNCNMYTYYRQNSNYTGKQKQVSKKPTENQCIKISSFVLRDWCCHSLWGCVLWFLWGSAIAKWHPVNHVILWNMALNFTE